MAFLKSLGLGRSAPRLDWIKLVGDDPLFERAEGNVQVWRFSDGDGAGAYFFDLEPDLPKTSEFSDFHATLRGAARAAGAALVDFEIVTFAGTPAIRQILRVPQKPSGMTYLGAITLPFAKFSYVLKVQCEERGVTGIREAVLLAEALKNKTVSLSPDSPNPIQGDWDPDAEKFDQRFPTHPLSRLRRHLRQLESCISIDNAALKHARFALPRSPR